MKNTKSVAVICSLLLMGPAVLSTMQSVTTPVVAAEEDEQSQENLVKNGDFSQGTDHWATWNGEGGDSTFTVEEEQGVMTIHSIAGMHPDWGIPISWSTQFQQPGIELEGNMRYEISFDAKSSIERPVTLERTGLSGNPQSNFVIGEEMENYTVQFNTLQPGTMMLNFLIGNVQHSGLTTPEEEHSLTFDNVSVRLIGDVEEDTTERDWQLTWYDEFEGDSLDLSNWNIDTGNGFWSGDDWIEGWGNNELQYYDEDNVRVEDGRLILEAREEERSDEHGEYDYTSGKITSDGLFSQAYGKFEARMKLPEGQGYWPAFWMMPQDDTYGGWAASGEIDIMENRGSELDKIGGAIHYGGEWPLNTHSAGEYVFTGDNRTTDFNNYSVEWEPEEIRWYVNDELYYRTSEWHSDGGYYPAPFNQEFFLILNLAVGGWYGGDPDDTTEFPAQVEVEYVRVYEDANADYDATPTPRDPEEEEPVEDDGLDRNPANWQAVGDNLVEDGSFESTTTFGNPDNIQTWNTFNMADHDPNGGRGVFSVVDEILNVEVEQVGWNWWQIQLFQDIALEEGTYKLAFDMTSEEARDMRVELVGSGEDIQVFPVDSDGDSYELIFHVGAGTERLLFGFGREHNEPQPTTPYNMTLDNVVLTAAEPVEETPEEPGDDVDGEWVYIGENLIENGSFDEMSELSASENLVAWNTHNQGDYEQWAGLAEFSVIEEVMNIEIQQVGWDWWQIQLFQDVEVPAGTYKLSFDMASEKERDARVELVRSGLPIEVFSVNEEMNTYEFILDVENGGDLQLLFGLGRLEDDAELSVPYTMLLDNVSLREVEFVESEVPGDDTPQNNRDNDNHNRGNHEERGNKDNENHNRGNHENRGNQDNSNRNTDNNGKSNR